MAKKIRRVRTFARTATKSQEKKLIENAKKLRDNPNIILPECLEESNKKYFVKTKKRLEKINRFRDNTDKLEKLSNKKRFRRSTCRDLVTCVIRKSPLSWSSKVSYR